MIFSKRKELAANVDRFMKENNIMADTFGALCSLEIMGYLKGSVDEALDAFYSGQMGIPHHNCFNHVTWNGSVYVCSICAKKMRYEEVHPDDNDLMYQWGSHHWAVQNNMEKRYCHLYRDGEVRFKIHENVTTLAQLRLVVKGWEHRNQEHD